MTKPPIPAIRFSALTLLTVCLCYTLSLAQKPAERNKPFSPSSQYRTWSVGIHGGIMSQANILDVGREFDNLRYHPGYGAYIKKQVLPAFALQAEFLAGKVEGWEGDDLFRTALPWSASLSAQFTLANINWRHRDGFFKPYLNAGAGWMNYKPWAFIEDEEFIYTNTNGLFVPVVLGAKVRVTNGINVDLGYRMNFVRTSGFDGLMTSDARDIFSYSHIGLEFALGKKSKPYLGNTNPVAELYHVQQAQYDELLAAMDQQKTALEAKAKELEHENNRMRAQIERIYADFADDDGDGVANRYDQCPDTPKGAKVDGSGCPLPEAKAPVIQQIIVTEEDRRVVDEAIKNLEFDLSKATIRPSSYPSLNKVAVLLIEKNFSLKLAGHTDNTGPMALNLRLSKDRAEAVKSYLVSKGANPSRIEATGYGPSQPIADNSTEEGRQLNRRVEFTLF